jgi:23S rRNA (adenine2503-C2)-methyltransferase
MGFSRQLTSEEIFEQVSRFSSELAFQDKQDKKNKGKNKEQSSSSGRAARLSNIVFMGMGEPLANYKNVKEAVQRIQRELGIG